MKIYEKYNQERHDDTLQRIFKKANSKIIKNGFPDIWTLEMIKIHNCIVNNSVIIEKKILEQIGGVPYKKRGQDYACWLNCIKVY